MRPVSLGIFLLGAALVPAHAQSRVAPTPVVPPGAPVIEWVTANWQESVLAWGNVCGNVSPWSKELGICQFDRRITLLSGPLASTRGNLSACTNTASGVAFWCVWRTVKVNGTLANQWLTSLLPDRRLVMHGGAKELYVTKVIGALADSSSRASREAPPPTYSAADEGPLSARSPAPVFPVQERGSVDLASMLVPERQSGRLEGVAKVEGAKLDLVGRRFLIVEDGMLRLKQGSTTLESWPLYPKTYIVRYPDRSIEIHTLWAKLGY